MSDMFFFTFSVYFKVYCGCSSWGGCCSYTGPVVSPALGSVLYNNGGNSGSVSTTGDRWGWSPV